MNLALVETKKQPSYRDKKADGKFIYSCPRCVKSCTVIIEHTLPQENGRQIFLNTLSQNNVAKCGLCGEIVAILKDHKWLKLAGV